MECIIKNTEMNKLLPLTDKKKWLTQWTSRDWNPETYISRHVYIQLFTYV
jgi:hypothetical protein